MQRLIRSFVTLDKIGKDEAERDYHEKLIPALQVYPFSQTPQQITNVAIFRVGQTYLIPPLHLPIP